MNTTAERETTMRNATKRLRGLLALLVVPALLAIGGCDDLLSVDNPALIEEDDLTDVELVEFLMNGVVGEFQDMYGYQALMSSLFTDELVTAGTYWANRPFDKRTIDADNPYVSDRYTAAHRARGAADSLAARIESLIGDDAASSLAMATARTYAGYSLTLIGEQFCESPIDMSAAYTPAQILAMAIDRFDAAIGIAQAAGGAEAADLVNLARVGAARAALQRGDDQAAIQYASQVPDDFVYWVAFSDNSTGQNNPYFEWVTNLDKVGVDDPFRDLGDPRVMHEAEETLLEDGRTGYEPFQPYTFSGWDGADPQLFATTTNMLLASGLEARYIVAEAGGMSDAELRAFIDERRAVGQQGAFGGTDAELFDELLDQRGRDFYLDGHRLGDLRRYRDRYGMDLFPTGVYPQTNELYGDAVCYPIPSSERNSNPNL